ncbi:MAG TPA: hypothetical protein VIK13_09515, partial [Candidatus Limnocylindrales bacterium]
MSEGLVLATDSAMAVQGELALPGRAPQTGLLKVYNSATKIVQLREWPIGLVTFGIGQIRNRTIESHVQEFAEAQDPEQPASIQELAQDLHGFIAGRLGPVPAGASLGIHLAGYAPTGFFPEQYLLTFPGSVERMRPDRDDGTPNFGATWHGMTDAINRVFKGFEPEAPAALKAAGVSDAQLAVLNNFEYPVIFDAMPLRDAIDFAVWLAEVAIGRYRFVIGAAMVVGPVDIAIITRQGFRWIK